jgi:hypothetical protein
MWTGALARYLAPSLSFSDISYKPIDEGGRIKAKSKE